MRVQSSRSFFLLRLQGWRGSAGLDQGKRLLDRLLGGRGRHAHVQVAAARRLHAAVQVGVEPLHSPMLLLAMTVRRLIGVVSGRRSFFLLRGRGDWKEGTTFS